MKEGGEQRVITPRRDSDITTSKSMSAVKMPNMGVDGTEADFVISKEDLEKFPDRVDDDTAVVNPVEVLRNKYFADRNTDTKDRFAADTVSPDVSSPTMVRVNDRLDSAGNVLRNNRILELHASLLQGRVTKEHIPSTRVVRKKDGTFEEVNNLYVTPNREISYPEKMYFEGQEYIMKDVVGMGGFGAVVNAEPALPASLVENHDAGRVVKFIHLKDVRVLEDDNLFITMIRNEIDSNDFEGTFVSGKILETDARQLFYALLLEKRSGRSLEELRMEEPELFDTGIGKLQLMRGAGAIVRQLRMMEKRGWLHRDVKTGNILIDMEHPELSRLVDHGLARESELERSKVEDDYLFTGTVHYVPEESIRGNDKDLRMRDIYGLAMSLGLSAGQFKRNTGASDVKIMLGSKSDRTTLKRVIAPIDMQDIKRRVDFLQEKYSRRPERDFAAAIYDVVRPHDKEVERLKYWSENGINAEWFAQKIESIASEMETVMQAESFIALHEGVAIDGIEREPHWQILRMKEALNKYNDLKDEKRASYAYVQLTDELESVGYDEFLKIHPNAIQDQIAQARKKEEEAALRQKMREKASSKIYTKNTRRLRRNKERIEEARIAAEKKKIARLEAMSDKDDDNSIFESNDRLIRKRS
jgi:serine/threonine protein kinase